MLIRARIHELVKGPSDKRARCPGSSWGRWPVLILLWIVSSPGVSPRGGWADDGRLNTGWWAGRKSTICRILPRIQIVGRGVSTRRKCPLHLVFWGMETFPGSAGGIKHLDYYQDVYAFRFNRRTSRSRGMLFYRLMQQAVAAALAPYRQLVDGNHKM